MQGNPSVKNQIVFDSSLYTREPLVPLKIILFSSFCGKQSIRLSTGYETGRLPRPTTQKPEGRLTFRFLRPTHFSVKNAKQMHRDLSFCNSGCLFSYQSTALINFFMPLRGMGISHGLKTVHRTVFLTPFRFPY